MDETPQPEVQKEKKPVDAVGLYLENQHAMIYAKDEYEYYGFLKNSIRLGSSLLPPTHESLYNEVIAILKTSYLPIRSMEFYKDGRYAISTGDKSSGKITVRQEDLKTGERSILNQQSVPITRALQPLEQKIFRALLNLGIIQKYGVDAMFKKKLLEGIENGV